jgi:hypothetical protein
MPKTATTEETLQPPAPVEQEVVPPPANPAEDIFDFSVHSSAMTPEVFQAYMRLQRIAIIRGDRSLLPDGKVMTRAEIETALGSEIGTMRQGPCC